MTTENSEAELMSNHRRRITSLVGLLTILLTWLMVWISARIYRVGILMYGKKPSLPEIWRWIRYA